MKKPDILLIERKAGECITEVLAVPGLRKATAYLSENFVIKATRQFPAMKRDKSHTLLVTAGAPNFLERRFVRICKKAGVAFPLKQLQLDWYNEPK